MDGAGTAVVALCAALTGGEGAEQIQVEHRVHEGSQSATESEQIFWGFAHTRRELSYTRDQPMKRTDSFNFTDTPSFSPTAFVAQIPAALTTKEALLQALYEHVRLPGYFGFNWDALSDCLRDLHWIDRHEVVLLHADLPQLPREDLRIYLEVLAESVASWEPGEPHSLEVVFPSGARFQAANQ
jgi:hypothetical protein